MRTHHIVCPYFLTYVFVAKERKISESTADIVRTLREGLSCGSAFSHPAPPSEQQHFLPPERGPCFCILNLPTLSDILRSIRKITFVRK